MFTNILFLNVKNQNSKRWIKFVEQQDANHFLADFSSFPQRILSKLLREQSGLGSSYFRHYNNWHYYNGP